MKITDMIISGILKKGILYEARNVDTDVEIPMVIENQERKIIFSFYNYTISGILFAVIVRRILFDELLTI